jgi:hypothetical protein
MKQLARLDETRFEFVDLSSSTYVQPKKKVCI